MFLAELLTVSFLLFPQTSCRAAGPETLTTLLAHSLGAVVSDRPEDAAAEAGRGLDLSAEAPAVDAGSGPALELSRPSRRPIRAYDAGLKAPEAKDAPAKDPLEGLPRPSFWEKTKMGFQMGFDLLEFPAQTLLAWKNPLRVLAIPLYIIMLPLALVAGVAGVFYNHLRRPS